MSLEIAVGRRLFNSVTTGAVHDYLAPRRRLVGREFMGMGHHVQEDQAMSLKLEYLSYLSGASDKLPGEDQAMSQCNYPACAVHHICDRNCSESDVAASKRRVDVACAAAAALRDVVAERRRQIEAEGWTTEHDDEHADESMALAAACYALPSSLRSVGPSPIRGDTPTFWPWAGHWWKPRTRREDLVRAAALLLAEIERIDRATAKVKP
jgi:hypothetical protein